MTSRYVITDFAGHAICHRISRRDLRALNEINLDQIRRFADKAGLPVTPIARIVLETIERTTEAWRSLDSRSLLPPHILKTIGAQIEVCGAATVRSLRAAP